MVVRIVDIVLWLSVGINIYGAVLNWKTRKAYLRAMEIFKLSPIPESVLRDIHLSMTQQLGADVDLFQRIETDITFMHEQIHHHPGEAKGHECPVCHSTLPEIRSVLQRLHSLSVHVSREKPTP